VRPVPIRELVESISMTDGHKIEVLVRRDGLELVRHRNGSREIRPQGRTFDSMSAALEAIATLVR
jgi:hypothetical protein